jgi:CysZ protein
MEDAFKGAACFLRGLSLLGRPRIRRYALAPFLVSAVVFAALAWFTATRFTDLVDFLLAQVPAWLQWIEWLLWIVFTLLAGGLVFFTFVLVVGIVGAPFHSYLAEAVEEHLTGTRAPAAPFTRAVLQLPGTMLDELKKVFYALLLAIPFLLLFLVPVVNIAAPVLWFLFCAWITAFSYADYTMSNHGLKLADIRRMLRRRRFLALGFGSVAFLALMTPILNLLAVPAAVCGGAVLWVEELASREPC